MMMIFVCYPGFLRDFVVIVVVVCVCVRHEDENFLFNSCKELCCNLDGACIESVDCI